jgi:hypothetical protein
MQLKSQGIELNMPFFVQKCLFDVDLSLWHYFLGGQAPCVSKMDLFCFCNVKLHSICTQLKFKLFVIDGLEVLHRLGRHFAAHMPLLLEALSERI